MRRSLLRSTAVAFFMAVAITVGISGANASDPLWVYAQCSEGGKLTRAFSATQDTQKNAIIVGSSAFCALNLLNTKYGVAIFQAGKTTTTVLSTNLRSVYLLSLPPLLQLGPREFGIEVARGKSGTFGACLVTAPTKKVACAKVIFDHKSGYVEFKVIPITDTLVNAKITGSELAVDPRCAACF